VCPHLTRPGVFLFQEMALSRCRAKDRFILGYWVDSVDLSSDFHLVAFCLIEKYCFVTRVRFSNALVVHHFHESFPHIGLQITNIRSTNLQPVSVLGCVDEMFCRFMFASGEHLISRVSAWGKETFLVWQKGDLAVSRVPRPQQHARYGGTANIIGSSAGKHLLVCGGIGHRSYQPTEQVFFFFFFFFFSHFFFFFLKFSK